MNKITLKVDFATDLYEFAIAEDAEFLKYNLSKMEFLSKNVAAERSSGKPQSVVITVFGRWVVMYILELLPKSRDLDSMLFFSLDVDPNLLDQINLEQEDMTNGIKKALNDYKKVYDPKVHDIAELVYQVPGSAKSSSFPS